MVNTHDWGELVSRALSPNLTLCAGELLGSRLPCPWRCSGGSEVSCGRRPGAQRLSGDRLRRVDGTFVGCVSGVMRRWSEPLEALQQPGAGLDRALLQEAERADQTRPATAQSNGGGHRRHRLAKPSSAPPTHCRRQDNRPLWSSLRLYIFNNSEF